MSGSSIDINIGGSQDPRHPISGGHWLLGGVRFKCYGCGRCCRGEPGAIFFTDEEAVKIAEFLGISEEELRRKYVTKRWGEQSFTERSEDGSCIFLGRGKHFPSDGAAETADDADCGGLENMPRSRCSIYPVRPAQCRMFPFWPEVMLVREMWDYYAERCPGMNDGPLLRPEEILKIVDESENWLSAVSNDTAVSLGKNSGPLSDDDTVSRGE